MYNASAVPHKNNIYVMAGDAPQKETYYYIFSNNIIMNEWSRLPPPGRYACKPLIINDKLTVIGGSDNDTNKVISKVSTFKNNTNSWCNYYPNLIRARGKPGVVVHGKYVIVLGGAIDYKTSLDDIEVMNWTQQPFCWLKSNMKLPVPMWYISLIMSDDQLCIVGFSTSNGRFPIAYQTPVDSVISSIAQPFTSARGLEVHWNQLPDAPHHDTALLPYSHPPVIIGGHDTHYIPTSDVAILNVTRKTWHRVSSLSSARSYVAVVPISMETILVVGGTMGGRDIEANQLQASSVATYSREGYSNSQAYSSYNTYTGKCMHHTIRQLHYK